jgi:hypothetical protein
LGESNFNGFEKQNIIIMKNFRDELRLITNNTEWTDNEKFEAIDELHERYVAKKVKLLTIPYVALNNNK